MTTRAKGGMRRMIKISKILSADCKNEIGVGIEINGQHFFISTNQERWPSVRVGQQPKYVHETNLNLYEFPEEEVFTMATTGGL